MTVIDMVFFLVTVIQIAYDRFMEESFLSHFIQFLFLMFVNYNCVSSAFEWIVLIWRLALYK